MTSSQTSKLREDEYLRMDATAMAVAVSLGELTPTDLLNAAIRRCESVDHLVRAVNMRHDQHALDQLDQLNKRSSPGLAPLAGVPMLIKDMNTYVQGTRTTNGCRFLAQAQPALHTSTIVKRYEDAGMLVFGKTATPEFGLSTSTESALWGATRNPWNLQRSAGGSSGGAAAAVAAGIVPVAHATDGGGSIRIPASYCGVFGLKPTRYRTPHGPGAFEGWGGASCAHVVSRTVRDSALLLDESHGHEPGSPYWLPEVARSYVECQAENPTSLRIGLITESLTGTTLDPDIKRTLMETVDRLSNLGHQVEMTRLPVNPMDLFTAHGRASGIGLLAAIRDQARIAGRDPGPDDLEPITNEIMQRHQQGTAEDLFRARRSFEQVGFAMDQLMSRFDVLLSPVTSGLTPEIGSLTLDKPYNTYAQLMMGSAAFTVVANVSGQPSMSVPSGFSSEGMPIGMMFTAALCREDILFALAGQLERTHPWSLPNPGWERA